ncbi:hypothetical protein FKM82_015636 [Ascaphus truei]
MHLICTLFTQHFFYRVNITICINFIYFISFAQELKSPNSMSRSKLYIFHQVARHLRPCNTHILCLLTPPEYLSIIWYRQLMPLYKPCMLFLHINML